MTPTLKIFSGGVVTALFALLINGPLGMGQAYINHLNQGAAAALAAAGGSDVTASFTTTPALQRTATLSGPISDPALQDKMVDAVKSVAGVHDARWAGN